MKVNCQDCDRVYYCKGIKIGRDPGMPCSSWGTYLPGDEPGFKCAETEEFVNDTTDVKDCPLYDEINDFICTTCGLENYCEEQCESIIVSEELDKVICPDSEEEMEFKVINNKYIVGIINPDNIDNFDSSLNDTERSIIRANIEKALLLSK